MRIDLVYPILPPAINGIGDYTMHMARALADQGVEVRILTGRDQDLVLPGIEVVPAFTVSPRSGVRSLTDAVEARPPDWLVVQFEQFSYGHWGLNPYLPATLRALRRSLPNTRVALMAHEDFVSARESLPFAIMSLWQRPQFWALGHSADHVFLSIDAWAQKYQRWFPRTPVEHLPVGSNIPRRSISRAAARRELNLSDDAFVVGVFGSAHPSRQLDRIGEALASLRSLRPGTCVLYVGAAGAAVREALPPGVPLHDVGPQPADVVSACFTAMDLYLTPFQDGVSTRRGSFLVGLQHEVATLSTTGPETDPMLHEANEDAFRLVPWDNADAFRNAVLNLSRDDETRTRLAKTGGSFFENNFSWPHLATQLMKALASPTTEVPVPNTDWTPSRAVSSPQQG